METAGLTARQVGLRVPLASLRTASPGWACVKGQHGCGSAPACGDPPGHHLGLLFQAGAGEQPVPAWGERRVEGEGPAAEERRLLGISQGRSGFGRPAAPRVL